ncbi:MAG: hypothetical protein M4579_001898 [Chaenotheca gracillima]|nr:MAG: hypothetical protein M4579_001898 [Chaenotheca gracillima]
MALAPKFGGQKLAAAGTYQAVHTIELYLDYVCPFSKKMFKTIYEDVFPVVDKKYGSKVQFIFRQQIQPWHPSSILTHEAGVAVLKLAPEKFYPFSAALFDKQTDFFDVNAVHDSRNQTYERLSKLAGSVGVDEKEILKLLWVNDKPASDGSLNIGNAVTDDMKLLVKAARLTGVHVSPTVLFNGIVENSISSGMTKEQWDEWLQKNVT